MGQGFFLCGDAADRSLCTGCRLPTQSEVRNHAGSFCVFPLAKINKSNFI